MSTVVHVHIVDPSAYTPPYDHALCTALARAGATVELFTSEFVYGRQPAAEGYVRHEFFYRHAAGRPGSRLRRAIKAASHVPDMLRYRRAARSAEVVHFQWLAIQHVDGLLVPRGRPTVLTAHDILPREARPGQRAAQRRAYGQFDAVVVHSQHGRRRLVEEVGVPPERVHVVPHGVFTHLSGPAPAPFQTSRPVVLCFGLMRPYKGLDVLLEAWQADWDAELWIVGGALMDISTLRAAAPANVRFVSRFVDDAELAGYFGRADLVVLPYLESEASGVLFTALAFGKPLVVSDVGGFGEIGAARLVPPADAAALRDALADVLGAPQERDRLAAASAAAAALHSWERAAALTLDVYEKLRR